MEDWGKTFLDWLRNKFHSLDEPPVEIERTDDRLTLQQGPQRSRLRYVTRTVAEALVYGATVAILLFGMMLFGRTSAGTRATLGDRLEIGSYLGLTLGPACAVCCFPVLLLIRRGQLEWSRLDIHGGEMRLTKGQWFGPRTVLRLDASQIADLDARVQCTEHLEIDEERELVDLTIDSHEDFETFAVGLPPERAQHFADQANQRLAAHGSSGAREASELAS